MLTFDANSHTYRSGGTVLPSVTQVLKATAISDDFSGIDPYYADRGTRMHEVAASELIGFEVTDFDEDLIPFVGAFREFRSEYQPEPLYVEHRLLDLDPPVAGTCDLIADVYGDLNAEHRTLIDWKCGAFRAYYAVQAAGYVDIARRNGIEVERAWVVSLKGGKPTINKIDLDVQLVIWRHALEKYHGGNHASNQD